MLGCLLVQFRAVPGRLQPLVILDKHTFCNCQLYNSVLESGFPLEKVFVEAGYFLIPGLPPLGHDLDLLMKPLDPMDRVKKILLDYFQTPLLNNCILDLELALLTEFLESE